jgi:predicted nuclease of predicted toxin-antitoxin system
VREVGLRDAEDEAIWQLALTTGAVIVTKDEDFAARLQTTTNAPQVLWLRVGNTSNRALRAWLIPQVPQVIELFNPGIRLVEVR